MTITAPLSAPSRTLKRALKLGCALAALGGMAGAANAQAFNGIPVTTAGSVTYDRATPGVETIRINSQQAVIDWRPVSPIFLPSGNVATFFSTNPDFAVLNRIVFNAPVRFDGTVLSQLITGAGNAVPGGTVVFSAPNGLVVGPKGVFDVGNLVLTTQVIPFTAAGDFMDPLTRGLIFINPVSPVPGASIVTEAGAQLRALQPNSFVALVGPVIRHAGSTLVNGSAAYIGAEQVTFRANQGLFDIIITTGSGDAQPVVHTGSTGGPSNVAAGDNHAIYLVAMPKNQAITAVLQGDIGFDPAVTAGVENGVVVLSAGANVVGGEVDRYGHVAGTPAPDLAASFQINGGVVRSDLIGVARTNITAQPGAGGPTLNFLGDVSLFGGSLAAMSVAKGQSIDVAGNALVSAAAFDTLTGAVDLTGGQARIFTVDGGTIHIAGTATVDASAQGLIGPGGDAGSGTGGSADVTANGGGVITIDGALAIRATGAGGVSIAAPVVNSGAGTGGKATLAGTAGGTVNANGVSMNVNGSASASSGAATLNGAAGTGGTVSVLASGTGNVVIAGTFVGSASGAGGDVPAGAGLVGGIGRGGTISVSATDGNIDFNANASFAASGGGGLGPLGGAGIGGNLSIDATRGTIDFLGQANGVVDGTGGGASVTGGPGGTGQGGNVLVSAHSSDTSSRITGGALSLSASGLGGRGGPGLIGTPTGAGGAGTGGTIRVLAESANGTVQFGALKLAANGTGGDGGNFDSATGGGTGGTGTGGAILIGTSAGPAPLGGSAPTGSATFASAVLGANGTGGTGGLGTGPGGRGIGGTVGVGATGAPATVAGPTTLFAEGRGGAGGPSPVDPTAIGAAGQGTGGTVNITTAPHPNTNGPGTVTLAAVTGSANATGGPTGNVAGSWHVRAFGGSAVSVTGMTLTAAAQGTGIGLPPASSLDPQNGTITVTGTAQLGTDGDIQVNASQAGRVAGGRYNLVAGRDIIVSHTTPAVNALSMDVANLFLQAARDVTVNAGAAIRGSAVTDLRALRLATVAGRVTGQQITIGSLDLDLPATGQIGDAATQTVILDVDGGDNGPLFAGVPALALGANQFTVVGGTTAGPGYTLSNAEAGRIRANTLRVLVPALGTAANRAPDLIVRDLNLTGGGAAAGVGTVEIITPGIGRVEGNVLLAGARAVDGMLLSARERLEVVTPTASVRVRDGTGAPGGTLTLVSNNIWVTSDAIITLLRGNPNYAGRDDDLIDNDGVVAPRGYVEGNAVTLNARGTLYVQNTTAARGTFLSGSDFGGVTTGAGGLTIVADAPNTSVYAFGRRLNPDGGFTTGDTYFFLSTYNVSPGANYTLTAALNTCIIPTGQCPLRVPPGSGPGGPDPVTGPTGGSSAIQLPQNDSDDVIDSSFAADPLIEEPVTSGNEPGQWNCDPDQDGDCDDQPQ